MTDPDGTRRPRLFGLLSKIPELISGLIRAEVASAKAELKAKLKTSSVGLGLTVGGVVLALFGLGWLIASGVAGLEIVLPEWAAALIAAVVLLIIASILAAVGIKRLKAGMPPAPSDTIESIKQDVRVVKGTAR